MAKIVVMYPRASGPRLGDAEARQQPWVGLAAALALVVGTIVVFGVGAVKRDRRARQKVA